MKTSGTVDVLQVQYSVSISRSQTVGFLEPVPYIFVLWKNEFYGRAAGSFEEVFK